MGTAFESGDLFLAATDVDDRQVDLRHHVGPGRILHYDRDLRLKGALFTGEIGLVVGLAIDPRDRCLYACDPSSQTITRFTADGERAGRLELWPKARIGALLLRPDGRFVAGLHSKIGEPPERPMPRLFVGRLSGTPSDVEGLAVEIDGGKFGFHCVTHLSLGPDGRTLYYVSEGGRRLMRYDLEERRQLPDLLVFDPDDPRGTYGPAVLADGEVLMATGIGAVRIDTRGTVVRRYDVPERRGWSRLSLALDGASFYLSNFIDGVLEHRDIETGKLLRTHDIGRKYCLAGLAEMY
ncbi:MAG: SMP-30/gluconolactonase/LRE family protein [Steroidobacteraceae bacterium]|nr:SMP-30/gluconolactonase/LRE family protein [Steroidobacteraceae bacterium]MDW8260467.1 SMP-30/gluconolactonase/LRE family protein [Gammaproteobacteria bacterium]